MPEISKAASNLKKSQLQHCLNIPNIKDYISLGLGLPPKQTFLSKIDLSCIETQYSPPPQKLKAHIQQLLQLRRIDTHESNIFLTSGAQQAISLLLKLFCAEGDSVICEEFVYPGFISSAKALGLKCETVKQNFFSGIDVDALGKRIKEMQQKPKLIYLIPDGHNPTSVSISNQKREALAKISKRYDIPIIEDDAYGFLSYENPKKSIFSINSDNTFYIGSFSKILAPSLRVGWIIAPSKFHEKLSILKEISDLNTSNIGMNILARHLEQKDFHAYLSKSIEGYRAKRDVMKKALDEHIADSAEYSLPESGMYFWLKLKDGLDAFEIYKKALEKKLVIMPGIAFSASSKNPGKEYIRLNFSHPSEEEILEGVGKLAAVLNFFQKPSL